jgi:hypothetical protein
MTELVPVTLRRRNAGTHPATLPAAIVNQAVADALRGMSVAELRKRYGLSQRAAHGLATWVGPILSAVGIVRLPAPEVKP